MVSPYTLQMKHFLSLSPSLFFAEYVQWISHWCNLVWFTHASLKYIISPNHPNLYHQPHLNATPVLLQPPNLSCASSVFSDYPKFSHVYFIDLAVDRLACHSMKLVTKWQVTDMRYLHGIHFRLAKYTRRLLQAIGTSCGWLCISSARSLL